MDDKKTLGKTTKLRTFNDQLQYPKVNNLQKKIPGEEKKIVKIQRRRKKKFDPQ